MRFQRLADWLDWQSTLHAEEIELGLERVAAVWHQMRSDALFSKVITVAGTNGKGSSVAMLEAIYCQAGYRVGTYTSPHLIKYNERIRLDGQPVSDARLCTAFERVDEARQGESLTYFEFGTLAALDIFASEALDLVILEVGLGGRLDAVNVIDPDVALITTVDLDHVGWLGDTREQIGLEKAGIMRRGKPVILGQSDIPSSVLNHAMKVGAELYAAGEAFHGSATDVDWKWTGPGGELRKLSLPALKGRYQLQNAAAVLMVVQCLSQSLPVGREAINRGLETLRVPGRFQIVAGDVPIVLDVAHNPQAVEALRDELMDMPEFVRFHAIFTLLSDKDIEGVVNIMRPIISDWHLVGYEGTRGQSPEQLMRGLQQAGVEQNISIHDSFSKALDAARERSAPGDVVVVFGSFLLIGEALQSLQSVTPVT